MPNQTTVNPTDSQPQPLLVEGAPPNSINETDPQTRPDLPQPDHPFRLQLHSTRAQTLSNDTRTCNTVADVYM